MIKQESSVRWKKACTFHKEERSHIENALYIIWNGIVIQ